MKRSDMRKRPWKTLRVVVEVTVPPTSRATEKDLLFHVTEALPDSIPMRRACHADARYAVPRVKSFTRFWPAFLRMERGLSKRKKKEDTDDEYQGL